MDQTATRDPAHITSDRSLLPVLWIAVLVGLLAVLCSSLAPLFDPDEGYYPATAAETLRSGPFWDLRFNDAPRWDKPILSYALIEGAFRLVGESAAAARFPSALEAASLVGIIGLCVARLAGGRAGWLCAVVVGSTLGVGIFSRVAHPEITVVASVVTAELLMCVWLSSADRIVQRRAALGTGIAIALGVLAKGPVAAVLPLLMLGGLALAGVVTRENVRSLAWDASISLGVAALLAAPWYAAMTARHGVAFLQEAVWQQNVGRYTGTVYGHTSGDFALWIAALVGLFPWLATLPHALRHVRLRPHGPRDVLRTAMCVSALTSLVFFSFARSKLPSYAFMSVPPLGMIVGLWLDDMFDQADKLRAAWIQSLFILAGLGALLLTAPWWISWFIESRQLFGAIRPPESDLRTLLIPLTVPVGCTLLAGVATIAVGRRTLSRTLGVAILGAIVPVVVVASAAPLLREMYPWEAIGRHIDGRYGPVWLMGRRAPSLTFYARAPVLIVADGQALEREIQRKPRGWLVVTSEEWTRLSQSLGSVHSTVVDRRGRMLLVRLSLVRSERNPS